MTKMTVVLLAALALLSACETMQGMGRDLQKGGNNLEQAAKSVTP
jgi:predicted small secreted protein